MATRSSSGRRGRHPRSPYATRTGNVSSRRRTVSYAEPTPPVTPTEMLETSCIDLTDDDQFDEVIVDLTSVNESPVVRVGHSRLHASTPLGRTYPVVLDPSDESSTELPEVDFGQSITRSTPSANLSTSSDESKVTVQCPVCFDSVKEIKRTHRQLMSTICGHLFCNECITESIHKHKCCPSCRKRLTNRQVHVIYL